jgi:hypothetical protein
MAVTPSMFIGTGFVLPAESLLSMSSPIRR